MDKVQRSTISIKVITLIWKTGPDTLMMMILAKVHPGHSRHGRRMTPVKDPLGHSQHGHKTTLVKVLLGHNHHGHKTTLVKVLPGHNRHGHKTTLVKVLLGHNHDRRKTSLWNKLLTVGKVNTLTKMKMVKVHPGHSRDGSMDVNPRTQTRTERSYGKAKNQKNSTHSHGHCRIQSHHEVTKIVKIQILKGSNERGPHEHKASLPHPAESTEQIVQEVVH
ncbi:hypothetical protein IWX49DRAFT_592483 [Phyllosticta citricarpa]|uniref:Uncharacterized protein n=1 Tax=Phyllosticta citricarpa TaxID=55181 RepID=A0ABR1M3H9_9PEZI